VRLSTKQTHKQLQFFVLRVYSGLLRHLITANAVFLAMTEEPSALFCHLITANAVFLEKRFYKLAIENTVSILFFGSF